jgi:hypothetical protein
MPIRCIELLEIARHALLDLGPAALHLGSREVAIPVVDRFELGAVDGHAGSVQQAQLTAEGDELGADPPDGAAADLAEVGDSLVIGRQASGCFGHHPVKAQGSQIECIDERIDDAHRVVLTDPVVQAFRKQGGLAAIHAFNKASHWIPKHS